MNPPEKSGTGPPQNRIDRALIGLVIAERYRVEQLLTKGGMGRVYLGSQLTLRRPVVLKVLPGARDEEDRPAHQRRFMREAATCARLEHPNTVTIFDYGEMTLEDEGGLHLNYIVMERVPGISLATVLKEEGALDIERSLHIIWEVARALREAHRKGVIHRDLKPANVMVHTTPEGQAVKVLDFGIAKVLGEPPTEPPITLDNRIVGSPRYMAPELILDNDASPSSDIYALGVMMYELLCGVAPFNAGGATQTMMAQIHQPVPPVRDHGVDLPPDVEAILMRCLAKEVRYRYPDVEELFRDIRMLGWLEDSPTSENTMWNLRAPTSASAELPVGVASATAPAPAPAAAPRTTLALVVLLNVVVFGWLLAQLLT